MVEVKIAAARVTIIKAVKSGFGFHSLFILLFWVPSGPWGAASVPRAPASVPRAPASVPRAPASPGGVPAGARHAKSEEVSSPMPAAFGLIDRWACKIGESFISYARDLRLDRLVGMQNQRKPHLLCPRPSASSIGGHAKSEEASSPMPTKPKVKSGRACKIRESFISMPMKPKVKIERHA